MSEQDKNTPPAAPAKVRAPDAATKATPHEHAKALGSYKERQLGKGEVAVTAVNGKAVELGRYSFQHASAVALHGWAEHEHHEAKPIDLSLDDYKKALLAASAPVVRAAVDFEDVELVIKGEDKKPDRKVRVTAKKGDVIDLRKLEITTEDLANKGLSFVADYEPHAPALSKHAAHVKNADAAKAPAKPADDDSHLFAKA